MAWWLKNNLRMIQNNIRDIDVKINPEKYVAWLKYFHANTLQIGCGGITAHYPSRLPTQFVNPNLDGDFIQGVVEACHRSGIRVIARFDFSKTHSSFLEAYPQWFVRDTDGGTVLYNDTAATCVNGPYQQQISLQIIREVLERYPVDGIFFNMFGYISFDYSGNHFGPCQCENCRRAYKKMYGKELPLNDDEQDVSYQQFKTVTVNALLEKIKKLVLEIRPDVAVSTYADNFVDIVRSESNSAVDRPLPFWIYSSEDNVGTVEGSYEHKIASNCCINAVDLPYRFMGVSKYLNAIRLYGNMAAGGGLDWCIIGNFDDYTDYENFDMVRDIFSFHEKYENYFGHFDSRSKIMLVKEDTLHQFNSEYRGVFRMLKENHLMFTIVRSEVLENHIKDLGHYDYILLPGIRTLTETVVKALANTSARVIASGRSMRNDAGTLKSLFGINIQKEVTDTKGTYMKPQPESIFVDFPEHKWIFVDDPYDCMELLDGTKGILPRVEKAAFGPPERCYGHVETASFMAGLRGDGNIYIPWNIGSLYYKSGYDEFCRIYMDILQAQGPVCREVVTNAPPMVEIFFASCGDHRYMLQAINMTGFNGVTFFESLEVKDIEVKVCSLHVAAVRELTADGIKGQAYDKNKIQFSFQKGELYKAFVIDTAS